MEKKARQLPLPPGSLGLPLIGETIPFLIDMNKFAQKRFKKHGDIFQTKILGQPFIYIKGASANRHFLTSKNIEITLPPNTQKLLGNSIGNQEGNIHKNRRNLLAKCFQPRNFNNYFDKIVKISEDYLEEWQKKGQFTWYTEFKNYTFDIACKLLIGLDRASKSNLKFLYDRFEEGLFSINPLPLPGTKFAKSIESRQQLLVEVEEIIKNRQQENNIYSDGLSMLLNEKDERGEFLSRTEVKDQILNLLFAGHSTLASALTSFCLFTALHNDVLAKLKEEQDKLPIKFTKEQLGKMPYLDRVLNEVLRVSPPIVAGFRKVTADFEYQGYYIPKDYNLIYHIKETHEDSQVYSAPQKFDPERFDLENKDKPFGYAPFGGGMRECLAKEFAKLEMKIMVALLVRNYQWFLLPEQNLKFTYYPFTKVKDELKVNFIKR